MIKELTHILADMDQLTLGTMLYACAVAGLPLVGQRRRPAPRTQIRHQAVVSREPVTESLPLVPVTVQLPILLPWSAE